MGRGWLLRLPDPEEKERERMRFADRCNLVGCSELALRERRDFSGLPVSAYHPNPSHRSMTLTIGAHAHTVYDLPVRVESHRRVNWELMIMCDKGGGEGS